MFSLGCLRCKVYGLASRGVSGLKRTVDSREPSKTSLAPRLTRRRGQFVPFAPQWKSAWQAPLLSPVFENSPRRTVPLRRHLPLAQLH